MKNIKLVSLQIETSDDFNLNLTNLIRLIEDQELDSFILAPELCLNGYAYDRLEEAVEITIQAIPRLLELSKNKTISLTLTTKQNSDIFNTLYVFHNGKIIHKQSKHKLFVLNDERVYFESGDIKDIKIFQVGNLKVASLICFELRFIDLWKQIQGADLVIIPAMWGLKRKDNFETLTKALAVMNQCYVLCSDSANNDMAKSSGVIAPFGDEYRDDAATVISSILNMTEIKKMRRYMQVGITT